MTLPLIIASWMLILLIVAGLCATARRGDRAQRIGGAEAPAWEPAERTPLTARAAAPRTSHAAARSARAEQGDAALAPAGSIAAQPRGRVAA